VEVSKNGVLIVLKFMTGKKDFEYMSKEQEE
jgi:hypothetical protein